MIAVQEIKSNLLDQIIDLIIILSLLRQSVSSVTRTHAYLRNIGAFEMSQRWRFIDIILFNMTGSRFEP